jgi:hypothetical protein
MAPKGATTYAMSFKDSNELIFKTPASNYKDAYNYFTKLKQLPNEEFDKLFVVTIVEIKTRN